MMSRKKKSVSSKHLADFRNFFELPESEELIDDFSCAFQRDVLVHGRMYLSQNYICFHATVFGWVTVVVIPFADVVAVEKKNAALVIPNAISIRTETETYFFATFLVREQAYSTLHQVWGAAKATGLLEGSLVFGDGDDSGDDHFASVTYDDDGDGLHPIGFRGGAEVSFESEFFETAHDYVQEWSILDSDDEGGDRSQQSYARSTAVARVGSDASHSRGGRVKRRRGGKASASSARRNRVSRRSNAPLPPPDGGPLKFTGRYARVLNTDDRLFPVQPPPFDAAFPCGCAAHGKYSLVTDLELPLTVPQVFSIIFDSDASTFSVDFYNAIGNTEIEIGPWLPGGDGDQADGADANDADDGGEGTSAAGAAAAAPATSGGHEAPATDDADPPQDGAAAGDESAVEVIDKESGWTGVDGTGLPLRRVVGFHQFVNNPIGKSEATVVTTQTLLRRQADRVVVHALIQTSGVQYTDHFTISNLYCFTKRGSGCVVNVTCDITWHKSTWLKGHIEKSAREKSRQTFVQWSSLLSEQCAEAASDAASQIARAAAARLEADNGSGSASPRRSRRRRSKTRSAVPPAAPPAAALDGPGVTSRSGGVGPTISSLGKQPSIRVTPAVGGSNGAPSGAMSPPPPALMVATAFMLVLVVALGGTVVVLFGRLAALESSVGYWQSRTLYLEQGLAEHPDLSPINYETSLKDDWYMAHHGAAARDLAAWQMQLGDLDRTLASAHKALRSVQLGAIAFQQRHALLDEEASCLQAGISAGLSRSDLGRCFALGQAPAGGTKAGGASTAGKRGTSGGLWSWVVWIVGGLAVAGSLRLCAQLVMG